MSCAISSSGGNVDSSIELVVCWLELTSASGMSKATLVEGISPGDAGGQWCDLMWSDLAKE